MSTSWHAYQLGKDAFHRVPDFSRSGSLADKRATESHASVSGSIGSRSAVCPPQGNKWDGVESVSTRLLRSLHIFSAYVGTLALAVGLAGISLGAETDPPSSPSPAPSQVVRLEYSELDHSLIDLGLSVTAQPLPFRKEPAFGRRNILRGSLRFGNDPDQAVPFAWDNTEGRLFLDLNGNQDLTDDPAGAFSSPRSRRSRTFQTFTNVHLNFRTAAGSHPLLIDLNLHRADNGLGGYAGLRSFWETKLTFQGRDWQFAAIENLPGQIGSLRGSYLLLRPWESRNELVTFFGGSLIASGFSRDLFLQDRAFRLNCAYEKVGNSPSYKVELQPRQPALGQLQLTGQSLGRVILRSPDFMVILDSPGSTVSIPVGTYAEQDVYLKHGTSAAYQDPTRRPTLKTVNVNEGSTTVLAAGGPLTNSVTVTQRGKRLILGHQIVGADGASYQLMNRDRSKPPRFVIHQSGKTIASGNFEFG